MSEKYEILPIRYNKHSGQALVTIPKSSELYEDKFVKVVRLKE